MKTQTTNPTQEEKAAYMATYWGQKVRHWHHSDMISKVSQSYMSKYQVKNGYLLLTPLSNITDEDYLHCAELWYPGRIEVIYKSEDNKTRYIGNIKGQINHMIKEEQWLLQIADFLRSKGYALPWMGYTVEQLIEFGWLKLTQKGGSSNGDV